MGREGRTERLFQNSLRRPEGERDRWRQGGVTKAHLENAPRSSDAASGGRSRPKPGWGSETASLRPNDFFNGLRSSGSGGSTGRSNPLVRLWGLP